MNIDHRPSVLVTGILGIISAVGVGITDMLLNANASSGTDIFAVEVYELMANKTVQQLMWGSLGGIFILTLMAGYWHWYVGMPAIDRRWARLTLLTVLFGAIGGALYHFHLGMIGLAYQTLLQTTDSASYTRLESLIQIYDRYYSIPTFLIALIGFGVGSLLFFIPTIRGKTAFPRWYAFSVPIIAWPLSMLITSQFPAPIGGFVGVTWHWPTIIAFTISTIVLMRRSAE